jgi:MoaA/NifB/PqqE/SkfB family radical SAM enzyme
MLELRRKVRTAERRVREARMVAKALKSARHPILAHIIPIRRCNLSCTYCNEFDSVSNPVRTDEMLQRIDRLADLGTAIITLSGGEPLLHPDAIELIRHIRKRGSIAELITNGYLLTPELIRKLNSAGLDHLQISIDNVNPDEVSKKSLKVLDKKLQWLAQYAEFDVNINSVLGHSTGRAEDAAAVARRANELGLTSTVGIIHDHNGQLQPLGEPARALHGELIERSGKKFFSFERYNTFQANLIRGLPNDWHCRAGSRYLYICEDGLVHWCSQQRGYPGIPLREYTQEHLDREYQTQKSCAPYCTISCVHRVSVLDQFRQDPQGSLKRFFPQPQLPVAVRFLSWVFIPRAGHRSVLSRAFLRLLGVQ